MESQSENPVALIFFRMDSTYRMNDILILARTAEKYRALTYAALVRQLSNIQKYPIFSPRTAPAMAWREFKLTPVPTAGSEPARTLETSAQAAITEDNTFRSG